jgi:methyl coenzyme M reductase alpha subunit
MAATGKKKWLKKLILAFLVLLLAGGAVVWYLFTEKHGDTAKEKAAYTFTAKALMAEFADTAKLISVNKKYAEQIIAVSGRVTSLESADTTVNVKMEDSTTGSYLIFAFQAADMAKAKQIKPGDSIQIKGSCSGGYYSEILELFHVDFKRCAVQ